MSAPTEAQSGTLTTDGTEQQLGSTITTAGTYMLRFSTTNMAIADGIELRIYTKAKVGGSEEMHTYVPFSNQQVEIVKDSIPLPVPASGEFKVTIKRVAGTDRAYAWSIIAL